MNGLASKAVRNFSNFIGFQQAVVWTRCCSLTRFSFLELHVYCRNLSPFSFLSHSILCACVTVHWKRGIIKDTRNWNMTNTDWRNAFPNNMVGFLLVPYFQHFKVSKTHSFKASTLFFKQLFAILNIFSVGCNCGVDAYFSPSWMNISSNYFKQIS